MKNQFITVLVLSLLSSLILAQEDVQIIKPGAPGQSSEIIGEKQAIQIADSSYIKADVDFLQGMIMHHEQAVLMSSYVQSRTNSKNINDLAGRIDASQKDEIDFMQSWLSDRDEKTMGMMKMMKGMATDYQLEQLRGSVGVEFDRQFLQLMINHHDGAVEMVKDLRDYRGSAYDPVLNQFVSDLVNDQGVEIERMNLLLTGLSTDPRAGLSAGLYTAEEAILNLELVASLKKPTGFYDPKNPEMKGSEDADSKDDDEVLTIEEASRKLRSPMLSFSNTDMAFKDNLLVAGSYHGFNIYELQDNGIPNLITSVVCPGGQGDVSVVGNILIMSVEETRGRVDCGLDGVGPDASPERFRGIRIFDISNIKKPKQVGAVQTCRGSHTHSVVAGPTADNKIIVYNSGTGRVREEDELDGCIGNIAGDTRTAYFSIDVIEIPINDPASSRIVSSPRVFADNDKGIIAGLWRGGDHGDGTQDTRPTNQCHDITVFPSAGIAAGACSGNGILFDISDPYKPTRIDAVTDPGFAYWHSATFNNDGTKVVFTDEWGGGGRARCRAWDPLTWGADAIYDIVDGKLIFKSHYKMPAPQSESENCVAHNGSIIPIPNRDIFVQAWYQGGMSIMDFTDSSNPVEIAYFDRGPIFKDTLTTGGYWSTYFYEGFIYGTEITRGLDVFKLKPSEFLSKEEIAAAAKARPVLGPDRVFNPQQQVPLTWPAGLQ